MEYTPCTIYDMKCTRNTNDNIHSACSTFSHFRVDDSLGGAFYSTRTKQKPITTDQRSVVRWSIYANNAIGPITNDCPLYPFIVPMTTPSYPSQLASHALSIRGTTEYSTVGLHPRSRPVPTTRGDRHRGKDPSVATWETRLVFASQSTGRRRVLLAFEKAVPGHDIRIYCATVSEWLSFLKMECFLLRLWTVKTKACREQIRGQSLTSLPP